MAVLARLLALALGWTGIAALVPALVSARWGEGHAPIFLATTLACIFLAVSMHFAGAGLGGQVRRFQVFAALSALWVIIPAAAAPAISAASGLTLAGAWFEAISAFTTTGFSAISSGPRSLYVWLSLLQWSGGLLTIVAGIAILAPAGIAGVPDRAAQRLDERDAVDAVGAAKEVAPLYAAGFVLAFLVLLFAGNDPYVAFCLASAVTSAGAHLPPEAVAALHASDAVRLAMVPFFLWAATSVRWHRALAARRIHSAPEQSESLALLGYWLVLGLGFSVILFQLHLELPVITALSKGLFAAASLISTSGLAPVPGAFAELPQVLLLLVALVGGGALSVSGGLKILRVRAMFLRARGDLTRLISPNIIQPARTGEGGIGTAMRGVWVGMVSLFAMLGLTLIAFGLGAPSFDAAITGAVAAVTNAGPLYDAAGHGWPPVTSMPPTTLAVAAFAMIAGRIETVGAFVLIHIAFWRT